MALGSTHELTGRLLLEDRGIVLQMDDGGQWRLDGPRKLRTMLGKRVRVVGTRSGFDLLDVHSCEHVG